MQIDLAQFYRLARPDEMAFYADVLYPLQDRTFQAAAVYGPTIYLTGGTALARFHFHHRLSEDLDFFFTTTDDLKLIVADMMARLSNLGFAVEVEKLEPYFARCHVAFNGVRLKIDFAREFNLLGAPQQTQSGIFVNPLEDIGANKISAFEDRAEIKDIIDLYYICRTYSLDHLFELADRKRAPVAYESLLTINASGVSGRVLTTQALEEQELVRFLDRLRRRTEEEVKKKETWASEHLEQVIERLLWDFPPEERTLSAMARPVLRRRLHTLPLPARQALAHVVG